MLNRLDDYPVHQTPVPVAHAATSDPNFYDRYFFNGWSPDGEVFFAAALGAYPNRRVMDASFSVVHAGRQHVVHASRLAPRERTETDVGPIHVEVRDPMRVLDVRLDPGAGEHGLRADLRFTALADPIEEPRVTRHHEGRAVMDATRFTQFGSWSGTLRVAGRTIEVDDDVHLGVRDRSWGIRPVGERPAAAAPGPPPQIYWVWAPLHFPDRCTLAGSFEDAAGRAWHAHGAVAPLWASQVDASPGAAGEVQPLARIAHRIRFAPGTRRAAQASLELAPHEGAPLSVELEPILTFQMLGLGYLSPDWGHGMWKGERAVHAETWDLAALDPLDPRHVHVQQLVRARMGERQGLGVLEQLILGPHAPSGFTALLDGAP